MRQASGASDRPVARGRAGSRWGAVLLLAAAIVVTSWFFISAKPEESGRIIESNEARYPETEKKNSPEPSSIELRSDTPDSANVSSSQRSALPQTTTSTHSALEQQTLPPLPLIPRMVRPMRIVRPVYEFAARHPEVLDYVPCFCGCEKSGHRSNVDCFVASRDGEGRVTAWDRHGMT